jgi:hypothetical protein
MLAVQQSLATLLTRAADDPELLAALAADPLGAAYRAGVRVTAADFKQLVGLPGATDAELIEVLRTRLARRDDGCGGCEIAVR